MQKEIEKVNIFVGKNGAGKGSRISELLEGREDKFIVVSGSGVLKEEIAKGTELGKQIKVWMDSGAYVPDEIMNALVIKKIESADRTVIADGFPRTIGQAEALLNAGIRPNMVIEIYLDDETVLERLSDRISCEKCTKPYTISSYNPPKKPGICDKCGGKLVRRSDDDPEIVKSRLKTYMEKTHPTIGFFANIGVEVHKIDNYDGERALKEIENLLL